MKLIVFPAQYIYIYIYIYIYMRMYVYVCACALHLVVGINSVYAYCQTDHWPLDICNEYAVCLL